MSSKEENGLRRFLLKVTASLIVVGVAQTVALGYWCGSMSATVAFLKIAIERVEANCCP